MKYLSEILILIGDDTSKLPALVILFLLCSMLDLVGLGLIAPYIAFMMKPDSIFEGQLGKFLNSLNLDIQHDILLLILSGFLIFLFLFKALATLGINYLIIRFAQNQQIRLRTSLMNAYQNLPYSIYLQRNSSEYSYSVQQLTNQFQGVLQQLLRTTSDAIIALVILGFLIWQNTIALCLLMMLVGGILIIYDKLFRNRMNEYGTRQNLASQEMVKGVHEGLEGLKEIRILGVEDHFYKRVQLGAETQSFNQRRYQLISLAPGYLLEPILVMFVVSIVLLNQRHENSTEVLLSTIGLFGVAAIRLKPIASQLSSTITTLRFQRDGVARLFKDVSNLPKSQKVKKVSSDSVQVFSSLKLDNIKYSYPNTKILTLQNLSLEINAGETIGLVGPSGCGKTTLVDVLLGLLEPQSGVIKLNGLKLKDNLKDWRAQVAYLPQQVFLIDDSLRCNVALGLDQVKIDETRLQEALHQARLYDLVKQLPYGANTIMGERGVRLSGGQRQRVALARAFYHGRSVLVMDEATSALDNETEKEIVEEIKRLRGHKTMIIIAHRLTTVRYCDRIYQLEKGKIVKVGTPDEVLDYAS